MSPSRASQFVYTPSTLNQEVRQLLEHAMASVWVEGEISNLARPSSGHLYFTLKDASAQIRCALFRGRAAGLRHRPENGDQVRVQAKVSLYPARGEFQLVVEHLEDAGEGRLRQAFEALKARLEQEGLFREEAKRPLPSLPRRLAVITSPTGAAVRDVLTVLRRRFPALPVRIYPVPVQGEEAAPAIVRALELAARRGDVDVVLLTRGGGSLEDLWPFNEESVARAIHACPIPVVSAVGHEVDVTIADFVADRRAATPSAAAELLSPDGRGWLDRLRALERRLVAAGERHVREERRRLGQLRQRLAARHPGRQLQDRGQRLDELEQRLVRLTTVRLERARQHQAALQQRLARVHPGERIVAQRGRLDELHRRLVHAGRQSLERAGERFRNAHRALHAVSPLATLERGYAIVRDEHGRVLRDDREASVGDPVHARLARGGLECRVERIWSESPKEDETPS